LRWCEFAFEKGITMIRRCASMLSLAAALILAAGFAQSHASVAANAAAPGAGRNPEVQPFTNTSIWNEPIGGSAAYTPAHLAPAKVTVGSDAHITVMTPTAPITAIKLNTAGWSGASRCGTGGATIASAPMPSSFVIPSTGHNYGLTALAADGHTLVQGEPFARCTAAGAATVKFIAKPGDVYSDGRLGADGGSGLSSLGGTLRLGELVPGGRVSHALSLDIYGAANLFKGSAATCYRWPAIRCDGYGPSSYGGSNPKLTMGALLALPQSLNLSKLALQTGPGQMLAWTLQNYGGYITNDTANSRNSFVTELGPAGDMTAQFAQAWGYPFVQSGTSSPWTKDVAAIFAALQIVDNNTATTIGGGGTPLQRLALPIAVGGATPAPTSSGGSPSPTASATPTATPTPTPTAARTPSPPPTPSPTARPTSTATPTPTPPSGTPHVLMVMEENKGYAATLGTCSADPYFCSLASAYASFTDYHGVSHPSQPNYFAITSGSTQGCTSDSCGSFSGPSLGSQLDAAHVPWTAWIESMPSACSKSFVVKHNPFVSSSAITDCAAHDAPYPGVTGAVAALDGPNAPSFVWITPNLIDDMHDGTVQQGDAWLKANLAPILASTWFTNFPSTVIVTMDEGDSGTTNQVPTVVISNTAKGQGQIATSGNHYGTLRSIEEAYRLTLLGGAASSGNGDLTGSFGKLA
jgi:hypothetical protein